VAVVNGTVLNLVVGKITPEEGAIVLTVDCMCVTIFVVINQSLLSCVFSA